LAALMAIVSLGFPAWSQTPETIANVKGELHSDKPVYFPDFWIELGAVDRASDTHRQPVQFDGSFQLRDIRAGQYVLRVTSLNGDPVHQELVNVFPQAGPLNVRLPGPSQKPSMPGTISVTQLRHPPSRKAFQAVASAQRYSEDGKPEKAAAELEKAIRLSPEYADAYNNLAVQYMRMGRLQEACDLLTRAVAIAGPSALLLSNLAYAQRQLKRFPDAIASARASLRLDSSSPQAHLILGSTLALDPRTRAESIPHLERAAETLPSARAILEQVRRAQ
jgi:tetratricopeptide (TPR) repeat protein